MSPLYLSAVAVVSLEWHVLRALWFVSEHLGAPLQGGKKGEGDFCFYKGKVWVLVSLARLAIGMDHRGAGMARIYGAAAPRGWLPLQGVPQ